MYIKKTLESTFPFLCLENKEQISSIAIILRKCYIFYSKSFDEHVTAGILGHGFIRDGGYLCLFLCSGLHHPCRLGNNLSQPYNLCSCI